MAVRIDAGSLAEVESLEREAQEKEEQLRSRSGDPAASVQSLHKARTSLSTVVGDLRLSGLQPPVGAEALLKEDPLAPAPDVLEANDHALTLRREAANARIRAARLSIQDLARQGTATSALVEKLAAAERAARLAIETHRDQQGQASRALEEARKATVQISPLKSPSYPGVQGQGARAFDDSRRATIQVTPSPLGEASPAAAPGPYTFGGPAPIPLAAPNPFEPSAPLSSPFATEHHRRVSNPGFAPLPLQTLAPTPSAPSPAPMAPLELKLKPRGNVNPTQPGVQAVRPVASAPAAPSPGPGSISSPRMSPAPLPAPQPLRPAPAPAAPPAPAPTPARAAAPDAPRRAFPRAKLDVKVDMESDHNFFTGFSSDISEGGIFIATVNILALGSEVELSLQLPKGGKIAVRGKVRWIREPESDQRSVPGMGIQFSDLTAESRMAIDTFIGKRDPIFFED